MEEFALKKQKRYPQKRIHKKRPVQKETVHPPILPGLSSVNTAKMLSYFMTFRSTVKELSSSLRRMEKMLDSTYQMFEIAQHVMNQKKNIQPLPFSSTPSTQSPVPKNEEIPVIELPDDEESPPPLAEVLSRFNPRLLYDLLKSPIVQQLISQLFAQPQKTSYRPKRKQG